MEESPRVLHPPGQHLHQSTDELSASALHPGDDGLNVVRSGAINVGRDADALLRRSCVQG